MGSSSTDKGEHMKLAVTVTFIFILANKIFGIGFSVKMFQNLCFFQQFIWNYI